MKKIMMGGVTAKLLVMGAVSGLLLAGLACIRGQLESRQHTYRHAKDEIERAAGGDFSLAGPYIAVPVTHTWYQETVYSDGSRSKEKQTEELTEFIAPVKGTYAAALKSDMRTIGIYSAPVFTGTLGMQAEFMVELPPKQGYEYHLDSAQLYIRTDRLNLSQHPVFTLNGTAYESDIVTVTGKERIGILCAVAPGRNTFSTDMVLRGAGSFMVTPVAKQTVMSVGSDWNSPNFTSCDYLPVVRDISAEGFTARWEVPYASADTSIGFTYVQPVNLYKQLERAFTYGILFIIVPFIVLFLSELFAGVSLHPVNYLLSGAACVIFFLLLLAVSEHLPFAAAYVLGACGSSLLVSLYLAAVTAKLKLGAMMEGVFVLLYAYLFFSLKSEDYAFLMGALFAFCILAAVMWCTRKVDWSRIGVRKAPAEAA